jgi:hypothetical protein
MNPSRWVPVKLQCAGKTKDDKSCKRYICGLYNGYSGYFEHPTLGVCDTRNKEWCCWQHNPKRTKNSRRPHE